MIESVVGFVALSTLCIVLWHYGMATMTVNAFTFAVVALDKYASRNGASRTPEVWMFMLFLGGGWVGGVLAMTLFRHKTRKTSFLLTTVLMVALNMLIVWRLFGWSWLWF